MSIDFRLGLADYMNEWKRLIRTKPYRSRIIVFSILVPLVLSAMMTQMDFLLMVPVFLFWMVLLVSLIIYKSYDSYKTGVMFTPGLIGKIRCVVDPSGVRWVSEFKDCLNGWRLIRDIEMDADSIYFNFVRGSRHFIPLSSFESMDAAIDFFVSSKGYLMEYRAAGAKR